jgi:hypothetical protein
MKQYDENTGSGKGTKDIRRSATGWEITPED